MYLDEGWTDGIDDWRAHIVLTVHQAALLVGGISPSSRHGRWAPTWDIDQQPGSFIAAFELLRSAVIEYALPATLRHDAVEVGWMSYADQREVFDGRPSRLTKDQSVIYEKEPDWSKTTIKVEALRKWLRGIGHTRNFFFEAVAPDDGIERAAPIDTNAAQDEAEHWKAEAEQRAAEVAELQAEVERLRQQVAEPASGPRKTREESPRRSALRLIAALYQLNYGQPIPQRLEIKKLQDDMAAMGLPDFPERTLRPLLQAARALASADCSAAPADSADSA